MTDPISRKPVDRRKLSYDSKCKELAEHFLHEQHDSETYSMDVEELAQAFQNVAEDFSGVWNAPAHSASSAHSE